jgi:chitinase
MREYIMKNSTTSYIAYPAWVSGGSVWYSTCQVTLYNMTDTDLVNPTLSFVVDATQTYASDSNFSFTRSGTVITGHLTSTSNVPAQGSVIFTMGVSNNTGTSIGNLPSIFKVNGEDADVPEDHQKPTVPQNVQATAIGSQTLSLIWEPCTDDVMVAGYQVQYSASGAVPVALQTSTPSININGLSPETQLTITVMAYDLSGNYSDPSEPLKVQTTPALPDPGPCGFSAAPFIDYTAWPTPQCSVYAQGSGLKNYVMGFLTSAQTDNGPRPCWGGQSTIVDSHDNVSYPGDATISDYGKTDITALRSAGGDIAISFGGANGNIIEQTITDIPTLIALYKGVIDNYQLKAIDFDFEGGTLQEAQEFDILRDTAALERHLAVMCQIQALYPALKISYTLPVDGQTDPASQGFNSYGAGFVSNIAKAGLSPSMFNGMTMDFGATTPPPDVYTGCVYALNAMNAQIAAAFPKWSSEQIWRRMGATPMFGYNDNGTDFTPDNQQQLLAFAQNQNLGCLLGWDATRDYNQGLDMCHTSEHSSLYQCTYEGEESYIYSKIIAGYKHS